MQVDVLNIEGKKNIDFKNYPTETQRTQSFLYRLLLLCGLCVSVGNKFISREQHAAGAFVIPALTAFLQ